MSRPGYGGGDLPAVFPGLVALPGSGVGGAGLPARPGRRPGGARRRAARRVGARLHPGTLRQRGQRGVAGGRRLRRQPADPLARRGRAAGGGPAGLDDLVAAGGAGLHGHRGGLPAAAATAPRAARSGSTASTSTCCSPRWTRRRRARRWPARPGTTRCASARPSTTAGPGRSPGWRSSPGWSPRWSAVRCSEAYPSGPGRAVAARPVGQSSSASGPATSTSSRAHHVDAVARALLRGVDHLEPQVRRARRPGCPARCRSSPSAPLT